MSGLPQREEFLLDLRKQEALLVRGLGAVRAAIEIWSGHLAPPPPTYQSGDGAEMPKAAQGTTAPCALPSPPANAPIEPPQGGVERPSASVAPKTTRGPGRKFDESAMLFSPARRAMMRDLYPTTDGRTLLAMLNALPGREIELASRLAIEAGNLGIRKSPSFMPDCRPKKARPAPDPDTPMAAALTVAQARVEPPPPPLPAAPAPRPTVPAAQPLSRMAAIMTVSNAIKAKPRPAPDAAPMLMDFDQVAQWAGQRGVRFLSWNDLPVVNDRADAFGHPRIARQFPNVGRRG